MKYLLVLAILFVGFWLWRSNRSGLRDDSARDASRDKQPAQPQDMIACSLCQLHVPRAEALPGLRGSYCCADHRHRAEA
jgi:uncharacterized protein